jgi:hypothetical protein
MEVEMEDTGKLLYFDLYNKELRKSSEFILRGWKLINRPAAYLEGGS